jgi:hypothetical protein
MNKTTIITQIKYLIVTMLLLPAVSAAICEATGAGACFYVATTGSDSNPGTFESPKASIEGADIAIRARGSNGPGSVIYVLPGVYYQNNVNWPNRITADGTAAFPITLKSYNYSDRAILDGSQNPATRSGGWQVLSFNGPDFYIIQNFELRNGPKGTYGNIHNSIIENLTVHDIYNRGVDNPAGIEMTASPMNNTIRNNLVFNVRPNDTNNNHTNAACIMIFSGNNNTVHNNELYNCNSGLYYKHHPTVSAAQQNAPSNASYHPGPYNFTAYRNYVHDVWGNGISIGTSGAHVYENIVEDSQWGIRVGFGDACRRNNGCRYNEVYHNTLYNMSSNAGGVPPRTSSAIQLRWQEPIENAAYNTTVRDNLFINVSSGIDLADYTSVNYLNYNCHEQDKIRKPYDPAIFANDMYNSQPGTLADYQVNGLEQQAVITVDTVRDAAGGDFRLTGTSPCRNAASDGTHMGAWISDNPGYFIGLYDALPEPYAGGPGDLNGDRTVNFLDVQKVLDDFGRAGSGITGDINSDSVVDVFDLTAVVKYWGTGY